MKLVGIFHAVAVGEQTVPHNGNIGRKESMALCHIVYPVVQAFVARTESKHYYKIINECLYLREGVNKMPFEIMSSHKFIAGKKSCRGDIIHIENTEYFFGSVTHAVDENGQVGGAEKFPAVGLFLYEIKHRCHLRQSPCRHHGRGYSGHRSYPCLLCGMRHAFSPPVHQAYPSFFWGLLLI